MSLNISSSTQLPKLEFYHMPDDVIGKCLAFEGNSEKRLKFVSKNCAQVACLGYAEVIETYRSDPRLKSIVEQFLPITTDPVSNQEYAMVESLTRDVLVI